MRFLCQTSVVTVSVDGINLPVSLSQLSSDHSWYYQKAKPSCLLYSICHASNPVMATLCSPSPLLPFPLPLPLVHTGPVTSCLLYPFPHTNTRTIHVSTVVKHPPFTSSICVHPPFVHPPCLYLKRDVLLLVPRACHWGLLVFVPTPEVPLTTSALKDTSERPLNL